ncbi:MAG: hypothetical protein WC648_01190 [Candidatus Paceibacterota bacterium]|jgi:hypothetical protein
MKNKGGRPKIIDEIIIEKLELAFSMDATDDEACFYADISPATLYNYQKDNPVFLERKNQLKQNPVLLARKTVVAKIPESYQNAMDYLKRKRKREFGDNVDMTTNGEKINISFDTSFKPDASV